MNEKAICQKQASRFLKMMENMNIESRQSFRKIYRMVPSGSSMFAKGHHVRVAMMEAVLHPQIASWVRINLAIRVGLKLAKVAGRTTKVQQLNSVLEAFHIAADAFMQSSSVEQTMRQRYLTQGQWENVTPLFKTHEATGHWISSDELAQIQMFKQQVIPGFIESIRRNIQFGRSEI